MQNINQFIPMLDLLAQPAFAVNNGKIIYSNEAARNLMILPEKDVTSLLRTGQEEYPAFQDGTLHLTLDLCGKVVEATVVSMEDTHLFISEDSNSSEQLQAMALASQQLRTPLSDMITAADRLFPMEELKNSKAAQRQIAQMNRSLHQLMRLVGNMSDAARYAEKPDSNMVTIDVSAFFDEVIEKAASLLQQADMHLQYQGLSAPVYTLADAERLERAIYNLISNAVKFSPKGSIVKATLTQNKGLLSFTLHDHGEGLAAQVRANVFNRFTRQPGLYDHRFGAGLGLNIVHNTATAHGGTVLLESPADGGSKITITIKLRHSENVIVRSHPFLIDYAGGHDHGLLELSDVLPTHLYENLY